jgi:lipooligosaccharide transport system permease protein
MQTGAFEAMWPIMAGIKWVGSYKAALATPITVADLALGQILWIILRVALSSAIFVAVIVAFGAAASPWIALAYPAAVLTGAAFATTIAAYTASLETEYGLSSLMRFGIVPMFLFSGTFFPVEQLPAALRWIAPITPLWHGVEPCRGLALETTTALGALGHVTYLLVWVVGGAALAVRQFGRRLVT